MREEDVSVLGNGQYREDRRPFACFRRLLGPNKELPREEPVGRSRIGWKAAGAHLAPPPSGMERSLPSRGFCVSLIHNNREEGKHRKALLWLPE